MPTWHPSGRWIMAAVERDEYEKPLIRTRSIMEGLMLTGMFVDMYAIRPDGSELFKMVDFGGKTGPKGFTGTPFTRDGRQAVWAQIIDGNPIGHLFGVWQLMLADFVESGGKPSFTNIRNISPKGAQWLEPGNFAPDGRTLVFTADIGLKDPQGQDQYLLDIQTGRVRNLTNTPSIWDEHGMLSPDGEKIFWMSSYPFRASPFQHGILSLKTEFMLMNKDGSGITQISHFLTPGHPEYDKDNGLAANGFWHPDGRSLSVQTLKFPETHSWTITFAGNCGNRVRH